MKKSRSEKMGLFNKVKEKFGDIFSEEVDDEPVKAQMIPVEIGTKEEPVSDNTALKNEEVKEKKIYFDDKDFETFVKPKEPPKVYGFKEMKKEESKVFKASPVISPVYGVLDKNYHKDDIKHKAQASDYVQRSPKETSIDDIRKKAYGTLEDTLTEELFKVEPFVMEEEQEKVENDMFDDLDFNLDGVLDQEEEKEFELDYVINIPKEKTLLDELKEEDELKNVLEEEKIDKDDLFDLIDSMYEKDDE
jgi:hypothetical protein